MSKSRERTNGTFIDEVTSGIPKLEEVGVNFLAELQRRRLVETQLVVGGLHWIRNLLLIDLAMFVTTGEIDATVPQFREEVHVDLGIIELVALVEERVTDVGVPPTV